MAHVEAYDATLRDGMGGGGMSLTAERSCVSCTRWTRSGCT